MQHCCVISRCTLVFDFAEQADVGSSPSLVLLERVSNLGKVSNS